MGHLALADAFVITADSVSMLSEACTTGYVAVYKFTPSIFPFSFRRNLDSYIWILILQKACVCDWNGAVYMEVLSFCQNPAE